MKKILPFLILSITSSAWSQGFILLTNGQRIESEGFSIKQGKLIVKAKKQGKMSFDKKEVSGYCRPDISVMSYMKEIAPGALDLVHRQTEGPINLYEYIAYVNSGYGGSKDYRIYLEKGDDFQLVFRNDIFKDKKEWTERLKSFVNDDPAFIKKIDDENFKFNKGSVFSLIKEYNLSKMHNEQVDSTALSSIFFYLNDNRPKNNPLKITVNGKSEQVLPTGRPILVNVTAAQYSKVCVGEYCEALKPSPYFIKYIQIDVTKNETEFREVSSTEAKAFLKAQQFYNNK